MMVSLRAGKKMTGQSVSSLILALYEWHTFLPPLSLSDSLDSHDPNPPLTLSEGSLPATSVDPLPKQSSSGKRSEESNGSSEMKSEQPHAKKRKPSFKWTEQSKRSLIQAALKLNPFKIGVGTKETRWAVPRINFKKKYSA